ncbi:MAG: type II toxin-antitoxin system RelE/ParE family toxin [Nitriliruptor sp.]|nr:MAG: type II toxin-antitoxin system RelE/ParE family toxin [Nitriliruptor sp.]
MSRQVFFEPEAAHELEAAALWYEAQRSGPGLAFPAAVDRTIDHLTAWPDTETSVPGVPAHLEVRQMPVARFPYGVVYLIARGDFRVLAVARERRRPGYRRSRTEP